MVSSIVISAYFDVLGKYLKGQGFSDDLTIVFGGDAEGPLQLLEQDISDTDMSSKSMSTASTIRSNPYSYLYWTRTPLENIVRRPIYLFDGVDGTSHKYKKTVSQSLSLDCVVVSNKANYIEDFSEAFSAEFQNAHTIPINLKHAYDSDDFDVRINLTMVNSQGKDEYTSYRKGDLFSYTWNVVLYAEFVSEFAVILKNPINGVIVDLYDPNGVPLSYIEAGLMNYVAYNGDVVEVPKEPFVTTIEKPKVPDPPIMVGIDAISWVDIYTPDDFIVHKDPKLWDGTRDYSFILSGSPYIIDTPMQYAALCYLTNGLYATDETCPQYAIDFENKKFNGETIEIGADLIFNDDYEESNTWMDLNVNSGHVNPPPNDCTLLRLNVNNATLNGNFNKILGFYYHQAVKSSDAYGSGTYWNTLSGTSVVKNLYIEHSVFKNYMQGRFALFCGSISEISCVQVRNCRIVASTKTSGGMGSVQFGVIFVTGDGTASQLVANCGIVNTEVYTSDPTGYASYRDNGLHFACWSYPQTTYDCYNIDVRVYSSNMQDFTHGSVSNCLNYNLSGTSTKGTWCTSIDDLITRHNQNKTYGFKLNDDIRYIYE